MDKEVSLQSDLSRVLTHEPKSLRQIAAESGLTCGAALGRLRRLLAEGAVERSTGEVVMTRAKKSGERYQHKEKATFFRLAGKSDAAEQYLRPSDYDVLRALIKAGKPSRATEIVGFSRAVSYASEATYALVRLHAAGYAKFFLRTPNDSGRAVRFWSATQEGLDRDALQPDPFEASRLLHNLFFSVPSVGA